MTTETYNLLEEAVQNQLRQLSDFDTTSKEGKEALTKSCNLVELLLTTDRDNAEYYDKEERREIEKMKNETERDKQKLNGGRVALEMAKIIIPSLITMIGYNVFQKRVMKFEETGRVSSTAGREMHIPKFW